MNLDQDDKGDDDKDDDDEDNDDKDDDGDHDTPQARVPLKVSLFDEPLSSSSS